MLSKDIVRSEARITLSKMVKTFINKHQYDKCFDPHILFSFNHYYDDLNKKTYKAPTALHCFLEFEN